MVYVWGEIWETRIPPPFLSSFPYRAISPLFPTLSHVSSYPSFFPISFCQAVFPQRRKKNISLQYLRRKKDNKKTRLTLPSLSDRDTQTYLIKANLGTFISRNFIHIFNLFSRVPDPDRYADYSSGIRFLPRGWIRIQYFTMRLDPVLIF